MLPLWAALDRHPQPAQIGRSLSRRPSPLQLGLSSGFPLRNGEDHRRVALLVVMPGLLSQRASHLGWPPKLRELPDRTGRTLPSFQHPFQPRLMGVRPLISWHRQSLCTSMRIISPRMFFHSERALAAVSWTFDPRNATHSMCLGWLDPTTPDFGIPSVALTTTLTDRSASPRPSPLILPVALACHARTVGDLDRPSEALPRQAGSCPWNVSRPPGLPLGPRYHGSHHAGENPEGYPR